jgi:lysylphosphatidylglycerol synthetase-like protein (DUF2156 family)
VNEVSKRKAWHFRKIAGFMLAVLFVMGFYWFLLSITVFGPPDPGVHWVMMVLVIAMLVIILLEGPTVKNSLSLILPAILGWWLLRRLYVAAPQLDYDLTTGLLHDVYLTTMGYLWLIFAWVILVPFPIPKKISKTARETAAIWKRLVWLCGGLAFLAIAYDTVSLIPLPWNPKDSGAETVIQQRLLIDSIQLSSRSNALFVYFFFLARSIAHFASVQAIVQREVPPEPAQ